jgi:hypothetical protein
MIEGIPGLRGNDKCSHRGILIPFLSRNKSFSSIQKSSDPSRKPGITQQRLDLFDLAPKRLSYFADGCFNVLQCLPHVIGYPAFHRIPQRFDRIQFWAIGW